MLRAADMVGRSHINTYFPGATLATFSQRIGYRKTWRRRLVHGTTLRRKRVTSTQTNTSAATARRDTTLRHDREWARTDNCCLPPT